MPRSPTPSRRSSSRSASSRIGTVCHVATRGSLACETPTSSLWGQGLVGTFELAMRVGTFAHTFAWTRQRDALPNSARPEFDTEYSMMLRRAVALTREVSDGT